MQTIERTLLLLITDFRGLIPQRIMAWDGYDLKIIQGILEDHGVNVRVTGAHEIDFSELKKWSHVAAIYASSQEQRYKQYLQAIVSNLNAVGVRLYPSFEHMLAHEDKAYQAICLSRTNISTPNAYVFGDKANAYEFIKKAKFPLVGKTTYGFGSRGVCLLNDYTEATKFVQRNMVHRALDKGRPLYQRILQRIIKPKPVLGLVVFQDFIPSLKGDWKILIWGNAACGLYRENRHDDFRASGSGKIHFMDIPQEVLDFSLHVLNALGLPWASLDIGYDGSNCFLLEYQGIHFGLTASEKGLFYYVRNLEQIWEKRMGKIEVEKEMATIIVRDLVKLGWIVE